MRKLFSVFLAASLLLTGCGSEFSSSTVAEQNTYSDAPVSETTMNDIPAADETTSIDDIVVSTKPSSSTSESNPQPITTDLFSESSINNLGFRSLDEPEFRDYLDNAVYFDLVNRLDSPDYFVENAESVYLSDEYIESITSNSQSNVYFGKTEQELQELFGGKNMYFI